MTADVDGRVAVVSGGSRGLGLVITRHLLTAGWRVSTFSRSENDALGELAAEYGERFHWHAADLAEGDTLREYVKAVTRRFRRIDLLINNAGVLHQELLLTLPPEQVDHLINCNLIGPIVLTQACARIMTLHGGGQIINVSSINAIRGFRGVAVYSAAKAGLDGFSRSLARELGPLNIRVNTVVPGYFDSDMTTGVTEENRARITNRTPLGRLGTPEEVLNVVAFLSSAEASFITGQSIVIDGGITC
jgi:3-oxoacyl-[acyl-carrier protein] reductase